MSLPRPASPRRAYADLVAFLRNRERHQLVAGGLAIVIPAIILYGFYTDGQTNTTPGRSLIYAESWRADRSDDVIIAQQRIDEVARIKAEAEKRQAYKRLEKRLGISPSK